MSDVRYRVGPDFRLTCPVCGCAIDDATQHTAWHRSLSMIITNVAAIVNEQNAKEARKK